MYTCVTFLLFISFAYLLGCFSTGYYYVRIFTTQDIRYTGSKSTGATNVGRILGKKGFIITVIIDIIKGSLIAIACKYLKLDEAQSLLSIIALVCGHIWPLQLRFHGGKGIAVFIGFFLFWNPYMLLTMAIIGLPFYLFLQNFTISGLIGLLTFPGFAIINHFDLKSTLLVSLLVCIIYVAHSENISRFFHQVINKK